MELTTFWFAVIAFLWTGYFVLEGFDFGVGLLAPVLSRNEAERKQVLGTIGPVWDGNEVWLITAVGAMFAAFPAWYAGMLSSFYLPLTLILVGLIVRGVGLEWRGKVQHASDRAWCDLGVMVGSGLTAFLWG
ncbi:cytochrome d ubiquinol oxidase subunit II, partial [Streptosporangium algeriense]